MASSTIVKHLRDAKNDRTVASVQAQFAINNHPSRAGGAVDSGDALDALKKIESRQWWMWASVIVVTLLLTAGLLSFTFPFLFEKADLPFITNLQVSLRALVGLV